MSIDAKIVLRWEKRILDAGLRVTNISNQIGSRSYLPTLFSKAKNTPNQVPEPSVIVVSKLGKILGLSIDEMMQVKERVSVSTDPSYKQALGTHAQKIVDDLGREISRRQHASLGRPSVEDVLNWWRQNDGRLEACDQIKESFDLIEVPKGDDSKIHAQHVGQMSLAALHLGASRDRLTRLLDLLPQGENQSMVVSYRRAARLNRPTFSEPLRMSVQSIPDDIALDAEYIRMQLPVTAPNKSKLIVSYCF